MKAKKFTKEEMRQVNIALQTEEGKKLFHNTMSNYIKKERNKILK